VYGRTRLDDRSSSWLQIEFGIGFQVNAKDKDFHPFTFADVYSNAFKGEFVEARKSAKAGVLHNKQQAAIALKRRIDDAIERAIKRAPPRSQVAKLKKFRSALRSRA
jgi:hypothetical protein